MGAAAHPWKRRVCSQVNSATGPRPERSPARPTSRCALLGRSGGEPGRDVSASRGATGYEHRGAPFLVACWSLGALSDAPRRSACALCPEGWRRRTPARRHGRARRSRTATPPPTVCVSTRRMGFFLLVSPKRRSPAPRTTGKIFSHTCREVVFHQRAYELEAGGHGELVRPISNRRLWPGPRAWP